MIHELENVLHVLKKINRPKNILDENVIEEEIDYIDDFPELLDDIHQNIVFLQNKDIGEFSHMLKKLTQIYTKLGRCIDNIKTAQDLIKQIRTYYYEKKINKKS